MSWRTCALTSCTSKSCSRVLKLTYHSLGPVATDTESLAISSVLRDVLSMSTSKAMGTWGSSPTLGFNLRATLSQGPKAGVSRATQLKSRSQAPEKTDSPDLPLELIGSTNDGTIIDVLSACPYRAVLTKSAAIGNHSNRFSRRRHMQDEQPRPN